PPRGVPPTPRACWCGRVSRAGPSRLRGRGGSTRARSRSARYEQRAVLVGEHDRAIAKQIRAEDDRQLVRANPMIEDRKILDDDRELLPPHVAEIQSPRRAFRIGIAGPFDPVRGHRVRDGALRTEVEERSDRSALVERNAQL